MTDGLLHSQRISPRRWFRCSVDTIRSPSASNWSTQGPPSRCLPMAPSRTAGGSPTNRPPTNASGRTSRNTWIEICGKLITDELRTLYDSLKWSNHFGSFVLRLDNGKLSCMNIEQWKSTEGRDCSQMPRQPTWWGPSCQWSGSAIRRSWRRLVETAPGGRSDRTPLPWCGRHLHYGPSMNPKHRCSSSHTCQSRNCRNL